MHPVLLTTTRGAKQPKRPAPRAVPGACAGYDKGPSCGGWALVTVTVLCRSGGEWRQALMEPSDEMTSSEAEDPESLLESVDESEPSSVPSFEEPPLVPSPGICPFPCI